MQDIHKEKFLGWEADGTKVYIELAIEEKQKKARTVNHGNIEKYKVLSISGYGIDTRYKMIYAGQVYDELKHIKKYAKEVDRQTVKRIVEIWKRWHLNDLHPNCEHQKAFNCNIKTYTARARRETKKCPKNYEYGTNWLVEKLPEDIAQEAELLFA